MTKHVREKCGKRPDGDPDVRRVGRTDGRRVGWTESRTDGDPDGHHHTIIRPVWRRAYKRVILAIIRAATPPPPPPPTPPSSGPNHVVDKSGHESPPPSFSKFSWSVYVNRWEIYMCNGRYMNGRNSCGLTRYIPISSKSARRGVGSGLWIGFDSLCVLGPIHHKNDRLGPLLCWAILQFSSHCNHFNGIWRNWTGIKYVTPSTGVWVFREDPSTKMAGWSLIGWDMFVSPLISSFWPHLPPKHSHPS